MLSRYLTCLVCAASAVFSLTIPAAQIPLPSVPTPRSPTKSEIIKANRKDTAVILAFKRHGEDHEQTIQITLGQPLKDRHIKYGHHLLGRCFHSGGSVVGRPGADQV
ncbi:hypothetical protein N0V91_006173 [Didymella pomorum]|uniref:Uncharacterized protein n=1 Tax=Didymella pomorum TaxID=749634 RepID=A0A9W8ZDY4_9PLEO|nr:hypothetical protein N0V91_006173 [Didymella pomorum]